MKKLRNLPMLGLVAAATVLSVVLGCGGSPSGNAAPNNVITMDLAGTLGPDDSISIVGFNIQNSSNASIVSATYFAGTGDVVKEFNPLVGPGQTVAVIAKVKVKETTGSTGVSGGTSTTTTTFTSTTSVISVTLSFTNGSNKVFSLLVATDASTGKITLTPQQTEITVTSV